MEHCWREYNAQEYMKTPALGCVGRGNSFTWPLTTPPPPPSFTNNGNLNNSYSNNVDCNCHSCKIIDVYKLLIIRSKYLSFSDWLDYPSLFEICPEMHALAKMAEVAINRQNRQTINKNSNEMAKGPFGKWRYWRKWRIWRKWRLIAEIAKL